MTYNPNGWPIPKTPAQRITPKSQFLLDLENRTNQEELQQLHKEKAKVQNVQKLAEAYRSRREG